MYQHLSENAKDILKLAEKLAQHESQEYVGTEHILTSIVDHGIGLGSQILQNCSITSAAVHREIHNFIRHSMEETWVFGRLPGTPHYKQVIALAIEEAEKCRDKKVGSEYLLLGLLREKDCVAEKALRSLGLTLDEARKQVARLHGRPEPQ